MKVKFAEDTTLQAVGVRGTSSFSIATTAHMFNILSSGLYSDKVTAVLRELGCNAMDAHVMSGQPQRPFEVKLPAPLDPTFYVKDWGPGLDHAEVTELYTTYGMSTKQHSDDATGAFGLGSKSPFAYADMFTIVAAKDGVQRIYTAHKENNAPVISLQAESPASPDWPHGVMVTLPVAPADAAEFRTKAVAVFRWFETLPRVLGLGHDELENARAKFRFRGPGYAVGLLDEPHRAAHVIMGNVAYPVDASRIEQLDEVHKLMLRAGIHLWLPMGAVMPTPSRESIQYDKDAQAALRVALEAAARDIARGTVQRIRELKGCMWEWARQVQAYLDEMPISLRSNVLQLVKLEVSDRDELGHITRAVQSTHFTLPRWAGSSASGPAADESDTPARRTRDIALWWLNAHNDAGTVKVSRKDVTHGGCYRRNEHEPVLLRYLAPMAVYYVDSSYGIERVRQALRQAVAGRKSSDEANALVVVGASTDAAREYAQRLAGPHGCDLPTEACATSSLSLEGVVRSARSKKSSREDPRKIHGTETVRYIDLSGPTPKFQSMPLASVPVGATAYALDLSSRRRSWRNPTVSTTFEDGTRTGFRDDELLSCLRAVAALRNLLGDAWHGPRGILVVSSAQLRQLGLAGAGFKPMGAVLAAAFATEEVLGALEARIERYPLLERLGSQPTRYGVGSSGLVGVLASAVHHGTPLGKALVRRFADNPVMQDAAHLVRRFRAGKSTTDVRALVNEAIPVVPALAGQLSKRAQVLDESMLHRRCREQFPLVHLLDIHEIAAGERPLEEVMALLECVFAHPAPALSDVEEAQAA